MSRPTTTGDGPPATAAYGSGGENRGLATRIVDGQAGTITGSYDADGNLVHESWPNGIVVRFPDHGGRVYNTWDDLLPGGGNYTEWTAAQAGAKRGAGRVISEGDPANPIAIYCWDHVSPLVRMGP